MKGGFLAPTKFRGEGNEVLTNQIPVHKLVVENALAFYICPLSGTLLNSIRNALNHVITALLLSPSPLTAL